MQHIAEVLKIIEGGIQMRSDQVLSYAALLADKLESDGDAQSAANIRKRIQNRKTGHVASFSAASAANYHHLPVDKDSRLSLADVSELSSDDIMVQLDDDVSESVNEFLTFVRNSEKLVAAGVGISPSMLIYGPPGCGKTELARYISAQLELPLLTARCDTLVSSFLGSTAKNIRSLFDHAAERPCILFLDEFDALAKARDDQHELGELKRVVVSLLQNIDALPQSTIILAATNHEDLLDNAVWRRFSYRLKIQMPSASLRERLLIQFLGGFCPDNLKSIIHATENMSGALIKQACLSSVRTSILDGKEKVNDDDLLERVIKVQYSDILQNNSSLEDKILKLRSENVKLFTTKTISNIFGISTGKVSQIINRK